MDMIPMAISRHPLYSDLPLSCTGRFSPSLRIGSASARRSERCCQPLAAACATRNLTPGELHLPPGDLAGEQAGEDRIDLHVQRLKKYGKLYKRGSPGSEVAVISESADVQNLLSRDYSEVNNDWPLGVTALLGPLALTNQQGNKHKVSRRALSKGFSREAVMAYLPYAAQLAEASLESWTRVGQAVPLLDGMKRFTFDISCALIMGFDVQEADKDQMRSDFTTLTAGMFVVPFHESNPSAKAGMEARTRLLDSIRPSLVERPDGSSQASAGHAGSDKLSQTPLQRLNAAAQLEGIELSVEELLDQSMNLLMASTETTAFTMCNMLVELADRPDILEKALAEQRKLIRKYGPEISGTLLDSMVYGEAVAREALRFHSPVPFAYRKALVDLEVGGYQIPKGWGLQLSLLPANLEAHMHPSQPGFFPGRWLDASSTLMDPPPSFMPFGGGAHFCLGWMLAKLEIKVMLALYVRKYACSQTHAHRAPLHANELTTDDAIMLSFSAANRVRQAEEAWRQGAAGQS